MQPLHLVERQAGAGRIVRVGEEDDFRLRRHPREDGVDIGGEIRLRRHHRFGARAQRHDRIDQKAMRGVDRLVAIDQIGVRQQMQEIVGAGAADDAVGIEPERVPDRLAQLDGRTVRIILEMIGGGLVGRDRARARPERRLVRRQLEYLGHARRAALAGHIGRDIEHAGTGFWTRGSHYPIAPGLPLLFLPLKGGGQGGGSRPKSLRKRRRRGPPPGSLRSPSSPFQGEISEITAPYSGSRDCRRGPWTGSRRRSRPGRRRRP